MNRGLRRGLLAGAVLCAAVILGFNWRTSGYTGTDSGMSREELLAELPEIAVTETDRTIGRTLLALPEVQAPAEAGEPVVISLSLVKEAVGGLLPRDAEILDCSALGAGPVLLCFRQGEKKLTLLEFERDGTSPPSKLIAFYQRGRMERPIRTVLYEHFPDGTLQKTTVRREWLYFLKG